MPVQVVWLEVRARSNPVAKPITIATTGSGHRQCSQNAPKPWVLSRPDQKMPRSNKRIPNP